MRTMRSLRAVALPTLLALLALPTMPALARQSQAQPQVQSPQQAQQAQQAREQAEAYLRKEESAATGRQVQSTDRANQDASVADEAAGHSDAGRPARSTNPNALPPATRPGGSMPGPSYGPVLKPRQPQATDPTRKDPAEVHDETDSLSRQPPAPQQAPQPPQKQKQDKQDKQAKQVRQRHAWQAEGPMAPRPLSASETPVIGRGAVPIPLPARAPQPVVPSSQMLNSCLGGACTDAAGGGYNLGPTGTGVSSSGRLCSSNGSTVQCF